MCSWQWHVLTTPLNRTSACYFFLHFGVSLTSSKSSLTQRGIGVPQYRFLEIAQSRASLSQFPKRFSRTNSGTLERGNNIMINGYSCFFYTRTRTHGHAHSSWYRSLSAVVLIDTSTQVTHLHLIVLRSIITERETNKVKKLSLIMLLTCGTNSLQTWVLCK